LERPGKPAGARRLKKVFYRKPQAINRFLLLSLPGLVKADCLTKGAAAMIFDNC
jgi:hypothetical protein